MKHRVLCALIVLAAAAGYSQAPTSITTARYIFPGNPKITSIATIKDNAALKQVWFAERDTHKIGTLIFPKQPQNTSVNEYPVGSIRPFKLAYAVKQPKISDNAVRPLKATVYSPPVWFIDFSSYFQTNVSGRDSIYALVPASKKSPTGRLLSFPVLVTQGTTWSPLEIQWTAPTKLSPAPIWFTAGNLSTSPPSINLFSLEPRAKGTTPLEAKLTQFSFAQGQFAKGIHVENGFAWWIGADIGAGMNYLYMMPLASPTSGFRWPVSASSYMYLTDLRIQPVYNTTKAKAGVLPDQVWITGFMDLVVLSLNRSTAAGVNDSICAMSSAYVNGLFADNLAKPGTGKRLAAAKLMYTPPNVANTVSFVTGRPTSTVQRQAVSITQTTSTINGSVRTVTPVTKTLSYSVGSASATSAPSGCISSEWDVPLGGFFLDLSAPEFVVTSICGTITPAKFDLALNEIGGLPMTGATNDAAICRISGKFPKSAAAPKPGVDDDYADEEVTSDEPAAFSLSDAYPNPFNPSTEIQLSLPEESYVRVEVFNMLGQRVALLADGVRDAGTRTLTWDAVGLPSGVYICRVEAVGTGNPQQRFSQIRKMMLMK